MTREEYDLIFKLPFNEASDFFRQKLNIPTREWTDLWQGEHAKGFMSAGAYHADLLTDLRTMVQKSIDGGMDIREFRKAFRPLVEKYGWELKGGGPAWRADLIWRTNISTAYAAGRWQQFETAGIKYLRYVHADGVRRPRLNHLAMHGIVRPLNDVFWSYNYPPQGFRCHCRAEPVDAAEYAKTPANLKQLPDNYKTAANEGWRYNVGKEASRWNPNLDKYDYDIAREMVKALPQEQLFKNWHDFAQRTVAEELQKTEYAGMGKQQQIDAIRAGFSSKEKFPVAVLPEDIKNLIGSNTQGVYLSLDDLLKQQISRQGQNFEAFDYLKAQTVIEDAKHIVDDGRNKYIFFADETGKWYSAVLSVTNDKTEVYLKSFRRSSLKDVNRIKAGGTELLPQQPR